MALAIEECLCGLFSSEFTFILKLTKLEVTSPHIPPQRHRTSRAGWSLVGPRTNWQALA